MRPLQLTYPDHSYFLKMKNDILRKKDVYPTMSKTDVQATPEIQKLWQRSTLSYVSNGSLASFLSLWSLFSVGGILSIGSAGSILSIGSTGSILSIGSVGSILSIGSAGKVLGIGGFSMFSRKRHKHDK